MSVISHSISNMLHIYRTLLVNMLAISNRMSNMLVISRSMSYMLFLTL